MNYDNFDSRKIEDIPPYDPNNTAEYGGVAIETVEEDPTVDLPENLEARQSTSAAEVAAERSHTQEAIARTLEKLGIKSPQEEQIQDPEKLAEERELAENNYIKSSIENFISQLDESGGLENESELLKSVVEKAGEVALDIIKDKYENPDKPEQFLAFHNTEHTKGVVNRIKQLANAINGVDPTFNQKKITKAELAGYFHDLDHLFKDSNGARKRITGRGEDYSAHRLTTLKESINESLQKRGKKAIFEANKDEDEKAIAVTKPSFDPNDIVIQKDLTPESPLEARLLALADLADFGIDGPEALIASGKKLAIEENSDIIDMIRSGKVLTEEEKNKAKDKLLFLINGQVKFATGRKNRFEKDLEGISNEAVKQSIQDQFTYFKDDQFDTALRKVDQEVARIKSLDYDSLLKELGIDEFIQKLDQKSA